MGGLCLLRDDQPLSQHVCTKVSSLWPQFILSSLGLDIDSMQEFGKWFLVFFRPEKKFNSDRSLNAPCRS